MHPGKTMISPIIGIHGDEESVNQEIWHTERAKIHTNG